MRKLISELDHLNPSEIVKLLNNTYIDQQKIDDYAIENMNCPECYKELSMYKLKEDMGEHFGFPSYKTVSRLICSCGWSLD
jgi:hypothetical protein